MKSNKPEKTYCSECGKEIKPELVGAETYTIHHPFGTDHPYGKYSSYTGERQYVVRFKCSKSKWFNKHSDYTIDQLFTESEIKTYK